MNKHEAKGKWEQFKAKVKSKYAELTDDDLKKIEAGTEKLAGKLQEKYGISKEKAEEQAKELERDFNS
ncbi:hypothetical protein LO80_00785 [Candidatus Francisella endociliophora]|uniref:CsbD-like domain-containing protein n=1 Tax=Candidatus Francisella endociliophora TaxID=653937 RepID=A0A097EM55_9GAMM|nr:CsbD family protein [Francisella sp. FSC1006]AIT08652.1 hypothetical protein LO80_00785 [Francisella sp. FSC1006]